MELPLLSQVRRLIRSRCCNYDQCHCLALDTGEECICPQYWALSLLCRHFRYCVLPGDPELEAAVLGDDVQRKCCLCGKPVLAKSNRAKYCPGCAVDQRRKKEAERKREKRRSIRI